MSGETDSPRILEVRGSSGAVFTAFSEHSIEKSGGDRVAAQGHFMLDHESLGVFPGIHVVTETSYVMDRLTEVPYHLLNGVSFVQEVASTHMTIWENDPVVEMNMGDHLAKVNTLCSKMRLGVSMFSDVRNEIEWSELRRGLTHGDATLENAMLHRNGDLALIDPIPATTAVPDLVSVDVGKMLQSAYGFEEIRYGRPIVWDMGPLDIEDVIFSQLDMDFNEILASKYWAMVHYLRAMPYMKKKEEVRKLREKVEELFVSTGL